MHTITPLDRAVLDDRRIDADMTVIVLHRRAENPGILGQVSLWQRRHHGAGAGACHAQANLIADLQFPIDPSLFNESLPAARRIHNDVRTKARRLKSSMGI